MAYVPATATNLSTAPGNAALIIAAQNKVLRTEMVLDDIFESLSSEIESDEEGTVVPEAVFLKLNATPTGANTVTVPMLMALSAAGQMGDANAMLGNEESLQFKNMTMHFNEIKKSVASLGWGVFETQISWMNGYKQISGLMANWFKEIDGRRKREALFLGCSSELVETPTSLAYQLNPNIFVPGIGIGAQPCSTETGRYHGIDSSTSGLSYPQFTKEFEDHSTGTYFIEHLYTALATATTNFSVTSGSSCTNRLNSTSLLALGLYVKNNLRIEPLMIGGRATYIFLVSPEQAITLLDPTIAGSLGETWEKVTKLSAEEANFPGVLGRFRNFLFVEDARCPSLTFEGGAGSGSYGQTPHVIIPGFMNPGNNDGRDANATSTSHVVFDVNMVLGKAAICEWVVEQVQYANESTEYGKFQGRGAYLLSGIQIVKYDNDIATDGTYRQNGSCLCLTCRPSI